MRQEKPNRSAIIGLLQEFVNAPTWGDSRRILKQHPELLSDQADAVLSQMIDDARDQGDEDFGRILNGIRALLRRCGEVGIDAAFGEVSPSPDESIRVPPEFQADLRRAQEAMMRYEESRDPGILFVTSLPNPKNRRREECLTKNTTVLEERMKTRRRENEKT